MIVGLRFTGLIPKTLQPITFTLAALIKKTEIYVRDLTKDDLLNRNLPKNTTGVVVTKIENDSPIMFLSENDVIVELQKKKVSNAEQFDKMVKNIII